MAFPVLAHAQATFSNQIRQVQLPSGVDWRVNNVAASASALSPLAIDPGGARFELWTTKNVNPPIDYLLAEQYVGTYVPQATVAIFTGDSYNIIPRTRCNEPFTVRLSVAQLLSDAGAPDASKAIDFEHYVQSYGATGTGVNLNRAQATQIESLAIEHNSPEGNPFTFVYPIIQIAGSNRAKVRGEERFTAMSLEDYQVMPQVLASQFVQIWPVADGAISGITNGQLIRFALPNVTLTANDVYPDSHTYAQVYKGAPTLGRTGFIVPGSSRLIKDTIPHNLTLSLSNYESAFNEVEDSDGQWTMELLTSTPFGVDRLAYVTFNLNRTIQMNASVTTQE
ncbi:hypothetical protein [Luteolibacter sp. Populi]|uniref:hypothetical protein n=1 Tax=Luteolibacter sp. Populi TaxID=3230487 RepID=UPI00346660E6